MIFALRPSSFDLRQGDLQDLRVNAPTDLPLSQRNLQSAVMSDLPGHFVPQTTRTSLRDQ